MLHLETKQKLCSVGNDHWIFYLNQNCKSCKKNWFAHQIKISDCQVTWIKITQKDLNHKQNTELWNCLSTHHICYKKSLAIFIYADGGADLHFERVLSPSSFRLQWLDLDIAVRNHLLYLYCFMCSIVWWRVNGSLIAVQMSCTSSYTVNLCDYQTDANAVLSAKLIPRLFFCVVL